MLEINIQPNLIIPIYRELRQRAVFRVHILAVRVINSKQVHCAQVDSARDFRIEFIRDIVAQRNIS